MDELRAFIESKGYDFTPEILDGEPHEVKTDKFKGWYVGSRGEDFVSLTFCDWREGDSHTYISKSDVPIEVMESVKQKALNKKESQQNMTKIFVQKILNKFSSLESLPPNKYWKRKKLPKIDGVFFKPGDAGSQTIAVLPLRDVSGDAWNIQYIGEDGQKHFQPGGRISGLFFACGKFSPAEMLQSDKIYVGEGVATCLSFHLATDSVALAAMTSGNIKHVVKELLDLGLNASQIVILADWDGEHRPDVGNTGMITAEKCNAKFGVKCINPCIDEGRRSESFDFSDLWVEDRRDHITLAALNEWGHDYFGAHSFIPVKKAKEIIVSEERPMELMKKVEVGLCPVVVLRDLNVLEARGELKQFELKLAEVKGEMKPQVPSEMRVAKHLLDYYGRDLIVSDGCVFGWGSTHWTEIHDLSDIYNQISYLNHGLVGDGRIRSTLNMFKNMIPRTSRNMFIQNPYCVTFINGSLRAEYKNKSWELVFGPHRRDDFSTSLVPIEFDTTLSRSNPQFNQTIKNLIGDSPEKMRALKQMYGACLMPIYPRLFMCVGKPGRGKSTAIILASKMMSDENVAMLAPSDMQGFMMESMIGKLINVETDIPTDAKLPDHIIKKIEDRTPILVNRKGRKAVRASIPAIHVFGANDLPPTWERSVGAYTRRWSFIRFDTWDAPVDEHNKDIVQDILGMGLDGIVNFAVDGLRDILHCNGKFYQSDTMLKDVQEWQKQNDVIQQFLDCLRDGELDIKEALGQRVERKKMWELFQGFYSAEYDGAKCKLSRTKFYKVLEDQKGLCVIASSGVRYFELAGSAMSH